MTLEAGIFGHTAAAFLKKKLREKHQEIVVCSTAYYKWIPSNIWEGVGKMTEDQVCFKINVSF